MSRLSWALRRLARTSWRERRLLAEATALVPLVHQLQQRLPFERWRRLLDRFPLARGTARFDGQLARGTARFDAQPVAGSPRAQGASPREVAWAIGVAADHLPGQYKCLPRAYATHVLLARHGHRSEVRVGVARDTSGKVEAHAWVDCQGVTVMGEVQDMQRFVPLPDFSKAFS